MDDMLSKCVQNAETLQHLQTAVKNFSDLIQQRKSQTEYITQIISRSPSVNNKTKDLLTTQSEVYELSKVFAMFKLQLYSLLSTPIT